jgi:hypothetical protein
LSNARRQECTIRNREQQQQNEENKSAARTRRGNKEINLEKIHQRSDFIHFHLAGLSSIFSCRDSKLMEQEGEDVAAKEVVVVRSGSSSCAHCHKRLLHRHQSMEDHLRLCHPNETPATSSSTSSTTSATSSTSLSQSHDSSTSATSSRKRKGLASSAPAPSQMNHIVVIEDEDEAEGEKEEKRSWEVGEEEEESRLVPRRVARKGTKRARTSSSRLKDKTTINVAITTTALPTPAQTTPTAPQNLRIREDEPPTTSSTTRSHARRSAKTPRTEDDGTPAHHHRHLFELFDEFFQN